MHQIQQTIGIITILTEDFKKINDRISGIAVYLDHINNQNPDRSAVPDATIEIAAADTNDTEKAELGIFGMPNSAFMPKVDLFLT